MKLHISNPPHSRLPEWHLVPRRSSHQPLPLPLLVSYLHGTDTPSLPNLQSKTPLKPSRPQLSSHPTRILPELHTRIGSLQRRRQPSCLPPDRPQEGSPPSLRQANTLSHQPPSLLSTGTTAAGVGLRVQGLGCRIQDLGFRVRG